MKVYLDDMRQTPEGWTRTYTADETIILLQKEWKSITEVSLDHDLGPGTSDDNEQNGEAVVAWLEEECDRRQSSPPFYVSVHSANPVGARRMRQALHNLRKRYSK